MAELGGRWDALLNPRQRQEKGKVNEKWLRKIGLWIQICLLPRTVPKQIVGHHNLKVDPQNLNVLSVAQKKIGKMVLVRVILVLCSVFCAEGVAIVFPKKNGCNRKRQNLESLNKIGEQNLSRQVCVTLSAR